MKYYVSKEKMQEYMDLSIDDKDLFPDNAPNGLDFLKLKGEPGNNVVLTKESAMKAIDKYLSGQATLDRLIRWADTMMMSHLFDWEDETDDTLQKAISDIDDLDSPEVSGVSEGSEYETIKSIRGTLG